MKKRSMEILVGIFIAVVLLCTGYMAIRLVNEDIGIMIEKATRTQKIIAAH